MLVELSVVEQRYQAVLAVVQDGWRVVEVAARLGVGTVASANVHYATPAEGPLADVLACIRAGVTLEAARHLRANHAHQLASGAEMAARYADLPEALANTALVAGRCTFALK